MIDDDQKRIDGHPGPVLVLVLNPSEPMVIRIKNYEFSPIENQWKMGYFIAWYRKIYDVDRTKCIYKDK